MHSFLQKGIKFVEKAYILLKMYSIKGQLYKFYGNGKFIGILVTCFLHLQGNFFNRLLCRLHQYKNHENHLFLF